jgi:hypothetical protein
VANAARYFGPGAAWISSDLLGAQHRRQSARLAHHRQTPGKLRPVEGHGEQEAQRRDRCIDARRLYAALPLVQLKAAYILFCCRVG